MKWACSLLSLNLMWQSNKLLISTAALKDTVCNIHVHEHAEYLYSYISSHQIPIISQCWHSLPHQFSSGSREALHLNWLLLVWVSNDDLRDAHGTHKVGPPPCVCGLQCSTSQQAQATLLWEKGGKGGGSTMTLLAALVTNRHCYVCVNVYRTLTLTALIALCSHLLHSQLLTEPSCDETP